MNKPKTVMNKPKTYCEKWPTGCMFCDLLMCDGKKETAEERCNPCKPTQPECAKCEFAKPQTNYDRIISKTPYELAEWIAKILDHCENKMPDELCRQSCPLYKCCNYQPSDNIEDWLKSPVETVEVDNGT